MNDDLLDWHNDQDVQRRNRNRRYQRDLENSDLGRSDRFPPGWYVMPMIAVGFCFWVWAIWTILDWWFGM